MSSSVTSDSSRINYRSYNDRKEAEPHLGAVKYQQQDYLGLFGRLRSGLEVLRACKPLFDWKGVVGSWGGILKFLGVVPLRA